MILFAYIAEEEMNILRNSVIIQKDIINHSKRYNKSVIFFVNKRILHIRLFNMANL